MSAPEAVRVLVVDDQPRNVLAMEAMLAGPDVEVVTAGSGPEALKHLLQGEYAVILLDVQMPGVDGFETASLIRQRERSRNTPIVFVTANGREDAQVSRGYSVGAVDYLFKPVVAEILRAKVMVFADLHRKSRALELQAAALARSRADLQTVNEQLARANRDLEAFSYSVSHDLRAPLRTIDGFSLALLEDCADDLADGGREHLCRIRAAAQRMNRLIDDMLTLSRLERSEMRVEAVDLTALAGQVADGLRAAEPGRQVEVAVEEDLHAAGDCGLLRIALENLLGNAWKFTGRQPHARIEVGWCVQDDDPDSGSAGLRGFFVRDNGAGFDMARAGKLFEAFQRLHPVEEFSGTGVGLATVKRIVQRHGGRVRAEAAVGKGASIFFSLPAARRPLDGAPSGAGAAVSGGGAAQEPPIIEAMR